MAGESAEIRIPVSPGELLDRLTIATVRCAQLGDGPAAQAAKARLDALESIRASCLNENARTAGLFQTLLGINQRLWELENGIRRLQDSPERRYEFFRLAHEVFSVNDRRSELKRQIDAEYGAAGEVKVFQ